MARLTAPLLSLGASGTIAKSLVYSNWKGIPYARVHVVPANPKSDAQVDVRNTFTFLNELWKRMGALGRASFLASAVGQPFTGRNKHLGENVKPLRDAKTTEGYVFSIMGGQALPPTALDTAGAAGKINFTVFTAPTTPAGYTFVQRIGAALLFADPTEDVTPVWYEKTDHRESGSYAIDPAALGQYRTAGWIEYTRDSDGKTFYSHFLIDGAIVI